MRGRWFVVVGIGYIARCAMEHDTAIALAFRRALGIYAAPAAQAPDGKRDPGAYAGVAECFRNQRHVNL